MPGVPDTTCVFVSTPSLNNREERSFEEEKLRRYEFYDGESEPLVTPRWPETTFGHSKAPAPYTLFDRCSLPPGQDFSPQSNERNIGEERGGWEG